MSLEPELHEIEVEAWNGLDAVMRIVNMARRAKLTYREIRASVEYEKVRIRIMALGDSFEARWLAAKLDRLPEVYRVETRRLDIESPPA